jgi:hypothetical protein
LNMPTELVFMIWQFPMWMRISYDSRETYILRSTIFHTEKWWDKEDLDLGYIFLWKNNIILC